MIDDTYEITIDERQEMTTPFELTLAHAYLTDEVLRWQDAPTATAAATVGPYLPAEHAWVLSIMRVGDAWTWDSSMDLVEGLIYFHRLDENVPSIRAEYRIPVQPGVLVELIGSARTQPFIDWSRRSVADDTLVQA